MYFTMNNVTWKLVFVQPNNSNLYRDDGTITLGVTDNLTKTVYVNNTLNQHMTQKVVSHELVHVACFEYGYVVNRNTEEIIADFLATYGREVLDIADNILGRIVRKA